MFSVCNKYEHYAQQMVPSELIEQVMAWFRYMPAVLIFRKILFRNIRRGFGSFRNMLSRRSTVNPGVNEVGEIINTETKEEKKNRIIAATMANMEWGEDISYLMAAFMMLPFSQQYLSFSNSKIFNPIASPTVTDVVICLFLISFPFEHMVSTIGITALKMHNVEVTHQDVTVFNDCNTVNPVKTEKSQLFCLICFLCTVNIMIAMAEL